MPHIGAPIDTHDGETNGRAPRPDGDRNLDNLDEDELNERIRDVLELDNE